MKRQFPALIAGLLLALASAGPARAAAPPAGDGRSRAKVVVLGFDGADARLVEKWMDAGHLPNLQKLRQDGCWSPLGTTTPPQTPVSWTSFATGINPGRHGIFDFLARDIRTYQPTYAMFDLGTRPLGLGRKNPIAAGALVAAILAGLAARIFRRTRAGVRALLVLATAGLGYAGAARATAVLVPSQVPDVHRKTQGKPFWVVASEAGRRCRIIRVPAMFPADRFRNGEIHSGLGVPDIRGNMGNYTYYTTQAMNVGRGDTEKGGRVENVAFLDGETDTRIWGPRNKLFDAPPEITVPLKVRLDREASPPTVTLTVPGSTLTLREGEWSDWVRLEFPFNPLIRARGIARFYLVSTQPFGLYLSPINLDPLAPVMPLSQPPAWSRQLAQRFGPYKTLGWENDTFALDENVLNEDAFLQDVDLTVNAWLPMMDALLVEDDLDLYVHVWDFTDRVGHMFWWTIDRGHPSADSTLVARYESVLLKTYERMDAIVGRVRDKLQDRALLLVCSDHGFNTWRKSVNYNTWLVRNGFMTLKSQVPGKQLNLEDLFGRGEFWPNVDWSKTQAYALGLGSLYVNLKGREAKGCVEPADYEPVRDALVTGLEAFVDSANGAHPVRRVFRREEVYSKFRPELIPDLFMANNPEYRVSWQTSLGGIPAQLFDINDNKWSGDHCSLDPAITKGIFFANRPFALQEPHIMDLYPTILAALDLPIPPELDLDGRALSPGR